jgi:hypothetical protein
MYLDVSVLLSVAYCHILNAFFKYKSDNQSIAQHFYSYLMAVGGQRNTPAALPPIKTRYPLYRGWVGPRADLDRCGKSRPPPEFDSRSVQLGARSYTGRAISAHSQWHIDHYYLSICEPFISSEYTVSNTGMVDYWWMWWEVTLT